MSPIGEERIRANHLWVICFHENLFALFLEAPMKAQGLEVMEEIREEITEETEAHPDLRTFLE